MNIKSPARLTPFIACVCCALLAACTSLVLQSKWGDPGKSVDSDARQGTFIPLAEREASYAIQNDDTRLRIAFMTTDPDLQERIRTEGMMIWFDPEGGEARRLGIRYPVAWGSLPGSLDGVPQAEGAPPGSRGAGWGKPGDELEIYTDGYNEHERMGRRDAGGISVHIAMMSDTLLYDISVPFRGRGPGPYVLDAAPGGLIGVCFETRDTRLAANSAASIIPFQVWKKIRLAPHP